MREHSQFTITTAMRKVLKAEVGDHLAAFEVDEFPDAIVLKKLETTVEPVKATAGPAKKSR